MKNNAYLCIRKKQMPPKNCNITKRKYMKNLNLKQLTQILCDIKEDNKNTYPVKFAIGDNVFEAGVDIQNKKIYLKNLWDEAPTIVWDITYGIGKKRIEEILTSEAKIRENHPVIYLYDELSFDGSTI